MNTLLYINCISIKRENMWKRAQTWEEREGDLKTQLRHQQARDSEWTALSHWASVSAFVNVGNDSTTSENGSEGEMW